MLFPNLDKRLVNIPPQFIDEEQAESLKTVAVVLETGSKTVLASTVVINILLKSTIS